VLADSASVTGSECIFCEIAAARSEADVVWSDELTVAFLDRSPLFKGHVLVVPRRHVATLADLSEDDVAPLFKVVRRIASVLPGALDAHGTFVASNNVVSQSVAHLHVHVVPRQRKDGLRGFFWPRQIYADGEAAVFAERIRIALNVD
jgi:histidine triad (HIT) family protein